MTSQQFVPYWLIHEPGKTSGVGTVDLDSAISAEAAVAAWREQTDATILQLFDLYGTQVTARLITEPFVG